MFHEGGDWKCVASVGQEPAQIPYLEDSGLEIRLLYEMEVFAQVAKAGCYIAPRGVPNNVGANPRFCRLLMGVV